MTSFPDSEKQFLCRGCSKWLGKEEIGARLANNVPDFNSMINSFAKSISGLNDNKDRFICKKCHKKRKLRTLMIWSLFIIIVMIALIFKD
jgi:hypothetical protein